MKMILKRAAAYTITALIVLTTIALVPVAAALAITGTVLGGLGLGFYRFHTKMKESYERSELKKNLTRKTVKAKINPEKETATIYAFTARKRKRLKALVKEEVISTPVNKGKAHRRKVS